MPDRWRDKRKARLDAYVSSGGSCVPEEGITVRKAAQCLWKWLLSYLVYSLCVAGLCFCILVLVVIFCRPPLAEIPVGVLICVAMGFGAAAVSFVGVGIVAGVSALCQMVWRKAFSKEGRE